MKKTVWVAGHDGMVGSAIVRRLQQETSNDILTVEKSELDLTRQKDVEEWMRQNNPDWVFIAAAKVGGIHANNVYVAEFIYQNLMIAANIIHTAYKTGVKKLMFLGSSCVYPTKASQPVTEEQLLTGSFEPTNQAYAMAKVSGIKMAQFYRRQYGCDFISVIPANSYGPGDNFDPDHSHVIPGLVRRMHEAKKKGVPEIKLWGTGKPLREFIYVDDMADGLVYLMNNYSDINPVNLGTGQEISIKKLAILIAKVIDYKGRLIFDPTKPDGMMRKCLDSTRLHKMGWLESTNLKDGLTKVYSEYIEVMSH